MYIEPDTQNKYVVSVCNLVGIELTPSKLHTETTYIEN